MAAPLKSSIISAFKAWVEFKAVDYETGFETGDSAQLRKLKLEGLYEDLKNEVRAHEAIITNVKNVLLGWSDLLRKMGGEERIVGNDDYNEFNGVHHVENTLDQFERNARILREYTQKVGLQLRIIKHEAEKERQQEELRFATAMSASGSQPAPGGQGKSRSLHSLYQLPTLQIRRFGGNRREWLDFEESFKCAVDNSVASEIEKLTLLRSLLEGEARDLISGFRLETRSYVEAMKLLKEYYGDDQAHVRDLHIKLANLKTCQTLKDTKNFAFELERLARELCNAKENIEGPAIYLALEKKLNKNFLREILIKKNEEGSKWSTTKFREALHSALQRELAIQEVLVEHDQEKGPGPRLQRFPSRNFPGNRPGQQYTYAAINEPVIKLREPERVPQQNFKMPNKGPKCFFCAENHWSDQCLKYRNASARIQLVRSKNLCMGCLSNRHTRPQCQKPATCFYCRGRHPRALCLRKFGQNSSRNSSDFNIREPLNDVRGKMINFQNKIRDPGDRFDFGTNRPGLNNWKGTGANNVPLGVRKNFPPFGNGGFIAHKDNKFKEEVRFLPKREEAPQQVNCQMIEPLNNEGLGKALLMTIEVTIFNPYKEEQNLKVLAFLDPGSQRSFITREAAEKLKLGTIGKEEYYLTSFGNNMPKKYNCELVKVGLRGEGQKLTMVLNKLDFLVNPLPYYDIKELYKNYGKIYAEKLSATEWRQPDVLLGMDIWHELHVQRMQILPSGFTICQSRLGPIMSGWGQIEDEPQQLITGIYKTQTAQIYSVIQFAENKRKKLKKLIKRTKKIWLTFLDLME